jgi:hypothetical protein
MLAEALGAWFDGADWEATMSAFQQKRDQTMKPMYAATLGFTRMRDMTPADQNLLKAVFLSPGTTRALAHSVVAHLPTLLAPAAHGQTVFISKMFAPAPEPAKT